MGDSAPVEPELGGDPAAGARKLLPEVHEPQRVQAVHDGRAQAAECVAAIACASQAEARDWSSVDVHTERVRIAPGCMLSVAQPCSSLGLG